MNQFTKMIMLYKNLDQQNVILIALMDPLW